MRFYAYGHKNISSTHKTTFEFTKDPEVTETGDCIIGVKTDFKLDELKLLLESGKVRITIKCRDCEDVIIAEPNPKFSDNKEMVIRKSDYLDKRTFAIKATKAAADFSRELAELFKGPGNKIEVEICRENS